MAPETNGEIEARNLEIGDLVYDPLMAGTHGQRIEVQWVGQHKTRGRTYIAGVEEKSRNPVQMAYDNGATVKVFQQ